MSSSRALIITGFQPFGTHAYNPSWTAAEAMAAHLGLRARLLPVAYATATQFARAHLKAAHPTDVLFVHLGLAAEREKVSFESRARNFRDRNPDNLERTHAIKPRQERALMPAGRDELATGLPVERLVAAYEEARGAGQPGGQESEDCGTYVCNALLYHSLQACEAARSQGQVQSDAIFVHLPAMEAGEATEMGALLAKVFILSGLAESTDSK